MFDYMKEELTDQEAEALIEKAAEQIIKRKMEVPAVLMLEMHKPLAFVASQAAVVFAPYIIPFVGIDNAENYSRLFAKRENIERLIQRLEMRSPGGSGGVREAQVG